jgi:hypothetical protein
MCPMEHFVVRGSAVIHQGQVFKLKARCADGDPLWAYRSHRYQLN